MKPFFQLILSISLLMAITSVTNLLYAQQQQTTAKTNLVKGGPKKMSAVSPNKDYKRILHTGVEAPSPKQLMQGRYIVPSTSVVSHPNLAAVAPKHREQLANTIASVKEKLTYIKNQANTPENLQQIAQLEQQLGILYERQSHEKECTQKH